MLEDLKKGFKFTPILLLDLWPIILLTQYSIKPCPPGIGAIIPDLVFFGPIAALGFILAFIIRKNNKTWFKLILGSSLLIVILMFVELLRESGCNGSY
ncbi:MAG TPA: hypothetical protein VF974_03415 [Patescibacteria group bacterium]